MKPTDEVAIEALRRAVETCSVGDCPDWARGILASLSMDGFIIVPTTIIEELTAERNKEKSND